MLQKWIFRLLMHVVFRQAIVAGIKLVGINYKKSCCLRIGPRCDVSCANITSLNGHVLPWTNVIRFGNFYCSVKGIQVLHR